MTERIANIIVLCEDKEQQNLIRRYLGCCGTSHGVRYLPLVGSAGAGSQYVREQFPQQVKQCRTILGRKASCLLIVMTDADNLTVTQRENSLIGELSESIDVPISQSEPIVVLIPKWHVETWIKCLLGATMNEGDSHKPSVEAGEIKRAAAALHAWTRENATVGPTCVTSLRTSLPRWRRIG